MEKVCANPECGKSFEPQRPNQKFCSIQCKEICHIARKRERRQHDPEYRERENARPRERWKNEPEFRERHNTRQRELRQNDPEVRERLRRYDRLSKLRAKSTRKTTKTVGKSARP